MAWAQAPPRAGIARAVGAAPGRPRSSWCVVGGGCWCSHLKNSHMATLLAWYTTWVTDRWSDLPWRVFDPTVSERMPTFAESELAFAVVALVALLHAGTRSPNSARRYYLLLWCCSLVGGAANDIVFSWLPIVDNFWRESRLSRNHHHAALHYIFSSAYM